MPREHVLLEKMGIARSRASAFLRAPLFNKAVHADRVQSLTIQLSPRRRALFVAGGLNRLVSEPERLARTSLQPRMSTTPIEEKRRKATQLKTRVRSLTFPVPYLSHSRFKQLREAGTPLLIIDAREPEEISVSTIPSAVSVHAAHEHIGNLQQAHGDDFNVVCYCTVGFRSGLYAKSLFAVAKNIYNYSLMEHLWGDGTLISSQEEEQTRVHLYSRHYESYFPDKYPAEAFGGMTAILRGLSHLPSLLSVVAGKKLHLEEEPIGS